MIKVAYIIPTLSQGGAEMQQINILNGIDHAAFEVKVFVLKEKKELFNFIDPNLVDKIEFIGVDSFLSFGKFFSLIRRIRSFSPDIIHSQMYNANILARFLSVLASNKVKVVNHSHGLSEWIDKPRLVLDKLSSSLVDRFILVSPASLDIRVSREKYPLEKILLLPNSVSEKLRNIPLRPIAKGQVIFGIACRLIPLKNVEGAINLIKQLNYMGMPCKLIVAGDGPERERLENIATSVNLDVEFIGFTDDMAAFFQKIDIFCLSSTTEDLPLSIIEAMMAGKPVVSSKVGGIPKLFKGLNGAHLLDDFFSDDDIYTVKNFIDKLHCFDYRSELIAYAESNFSNSNYCNNLANLYVSLLKVESDEVIGNPPKNNSN